jgi:hypothetical protein
VVALLADQYKIIAGHLIDMVAPGFRFCIGTAISLSFR